MYQFTEQTNNLRYIKHIKREIKTNSETFLLETQGGFRSRSWEDAEFSLKMIAEERNNF